MLKALEWKQHKLYAIDQTKLPEKTVKMLLRTPQQIAEALKQRQIAGSLTLGTVAAFGVAMAVKAAPQATTFEKLLQQMDKLSDLLRKIRPSSRNLQWALERMRRCALSHRDRKLASLREILMREALTLFKENEKVTQALSEQGAPLLREGDTVLTLGCTGPLATGGRGTALGMITEAASRFSQLNVLLCESRPRLQGSRLGALELKQAKVSFRLITDGTAAACMRQGLVNVVVAGAERVAMNGDAVALIGTYALAMLAYYHNLPFYLAAPVATIDRGLVSGEFVTLEERAADEVTQCKGKPLTVPGVKVLNPAIDVTPHKFISAIVTELGVVRAPYDQNLRNLLSTLV